MPDGMVVESVDLGELNSLVSRLDLGVQITVAAALYEQMLDVMDEAKTLCPKDTHALVNSGRVNQAQLRGGEVSISLDFGIEPPVSYALEQHENLSYHHKSGEQAKYLEQPLLEWASSGGPASVIEDVEDYLGRSIR